MLLICELCPLGEIYLDFYSIRECVMLYININLLVYICIYKNKNLIDMYRWYVTYESKQMIAYDIYIYIYMIAYGQ